MTALYWLHRDISSSLQSTQCIPQNAVIGLTFIFAIYCTAYPTFYPRWALLIRLDIFIISICCGLLRVCLIKSRWMYWQNMPKNNLWLKVYVGLNMLVVALHTQISTSWKTCFVVWIIAKFILVTKTLRPHTMYFPWRKPFTFTF